MRLMNPVLSQKTGPAENGAKRQREESPAENKSWCESKI